MRKTLLIAAAAFAASVISSQAQVYSQNVVGYANIPTPGAGKEYLISVPFSIGSSNGANEVFGTSLPAGTSLLLWNGTGFNTVVYDNTDPLGLGTAVDWYNATESAAVTIPTLPVGQGFFIIPAAPTTNLFAGTVSANVGTSNNLVLANPGKEYLVASTVPYAGAVTNGNNSTGGPNLNNLPAGTSLLFWTGAGYTTVVYDNTDPLGLGAAAPNWYNGTESAAYVDPSSGGNVPTISVAQGFFIIPAAAYTWITGL
jgi:hypothetical protein